MAYRRHKYGAKPVNFGGRRFDSTGEGHRYLFLRQCMTEGKIYDLRLQVKFELAAPEYQMRIGAKGKPVRGPILLHGISYVADFVYTLPSGAVVVEDYKGFETPEFHIKERLMRDMLGVTIYKPKTPAAPLGPGNYNNSNL